jgi:hypothetical protein
MKLGNADGGKASYQLTPLLGTHLLHTEVGIINGNKTNKDSRIIGIAEIIEKFTFGIAVTAVFFIIVHAVCSI